MSDPQQIDLGVHRSQVVKPPRLPLSAEQVRAIYSVMRTFRDDDRSRVAPEARFLCARCGCSRPLAGSLDYGGARLCNGCATDYELLRTAGLERDLLLDDEARAEGIDAGSPASGAC